MNSMGGHTGYSSGRGTGDIKPKGYEIGQLQNFDRKQNKLYKQSFDQTRPDSYLQRLAGGDESMFEDIERPALRQFGSLQGNLASRFSGSGMGGRKSSGFQNAAYQQGSDFAQQLQGNRQNLQRQAQQDLKSLTQDLLGYKPQERDLFQTPRKQESGALGGWGGALGALGGGAAGFFAGGPAGAYAGASLGSKAFSGM